MRALLWFSFWFVAGGFGWALIALFRGRVERVIAKRWLWIDGVQAAIIYALLFCPKDDYNKAAVFAAVGVICLFLDLAILSRRPTPEETQSRVAYVRRQADARSAYGDLAWALLNSSEFAFNHYFDRW